ncbi:diguanylate cyclase [Roseateles sp. DAIF2]|uniref:GGDEF domain-containing protein n=1 Tax=Roseateles sp. DAIF2 TaxID=2714952 RepID=UPI0018A2E536|nr:GGDEF domain-containing protein [Roseateles sp. DAIF2]QPF76154.1 diguanylate cyclase [Roseateles sp. DAIF2]
MKRPLFALLLALVGTTAQAVLDPALDAQLDRLTTQAYDRPDASLQALQALRAAQHGGGGPQRVQLQIAEAQILVQGGRVAEAERIAAALEGDADGHDRALLLRAQIAERLGRNREAAEGARDSLTRLLKHCPAGAEAAAIARGACDFRAAWAALRILEREQMSQGTPVQALATLQQALGLAQAGQDGYMSAISMGSLALMHQEQDQPDEARRWLAATLELAQGEPLAMARAKVIEARIAVRRGDKRTQLAAYEEALDFATRAEAPRTVAQIKASLTDLHMHNGRPAVALQLGRQALPVVLAFKDLRLERTLRHNMTVSLILLKQFEPARRELARAQQLAAAQPDPVRTADELREIGQAWAASGQPREAIMVFHAERALSAEIQARNREAQLQQLNLKYDSERKQRDLELLTRDKTLKDQQLANHQLAQRVGIAVGALLALSLLLVAVMLKRVHAANKRLKANQLLLRAQSERDPLTDLANRRHFLAVMQQRAGELFSGGLLMVDIDHFKHVNDQHGHAAGDVVIREVARRISEAVRHEDLVVRWGGEEFLVFAPNVAQDALRLLAERILFGVGTEPVGTEVGALRITVSIGFAHFPLPPGQLRQHWEQAVNWADMVLYTAKAQGRNRAVGIATVDARDAEALLQIEADFDAACGSERVSLLHIPGP